LFEKSVAKLYTYERRTGVPNLKNRIMSEDEFESICKEVNVKPSLALDNKKVCKVLNDDLNKHLQSFKEILRIDEGIPLPSERCNLLREVLLTELVN